MRRFIRGFPLVCQPCAICYLDAVFPILVQKGSCKGKDEGEHPCPATKQCGLGLHMLPGWFSRTVPDCRTERPSSGAAYPVIVISTLMLSGLIV